MSLFLYFLEYGHKFEPRPPRKANHRQIIYFLVSKLQGRKICYQEKYLLEGGNRRLKVHLRISQWVAKCIFSYLLDHEKNKNKSSQLVLIGRWFIVSSKWRRCPILLFQTCLKRNYGNLRCTLSFHSKLISFLRFVQKHNVKLGLPSWWFWMVEPPQCICLSIYYTYTPKLQSMAVFVLSFFTWLAQSQGKLRDHQWLEILLVRSLVRRNPYYLVRACCEGNFYSTSAKKTLFPDQTISFSFLNWGKVYFWANQSP